MHCNTKKHCQKLRPHRESMADEIFTAAVMDDFGCNGYVILLNRANCSLQISGRTPFVQYIRSSILFLDIE